MRWKWVVDIQTHRTIIEFTGTEITGTDKTPKKFNLPNPYENTVVNGKKQRTKVHIPVASSFENTQTGHVYVCTKTAADAKNTLWKYVRTAVKKKPPAPATLTVTRSKNAKNTHLYVVSVKINSDAFASTSCKRSREASIDAYYHNSGGSYIKFASEVLKASTTQVTFNFSPDRTIRYPNGPYKVDKLEFRAWAENKFGYSPDSKVQYEFGTPVKPTLSDLTQDASTGRVSCTVKSTDGNDKFEWLETTVELRKTTKTYNASTEKYTTTTSTVTKTSRETSFPASIDIPNRYGYGNNDSCTIVAQATAKGLRGDTKSDTKRIVVSKPRAATIKSPKISGTGIDAVAMFGVALSTDAEHPTTNVRLEKLVSSDYEWSWDIPAGASWQTTNVQDDGNCTALSCPVSDINPERGKYTWVRVKSWNAIESLFYRYSNPLRVSALERPAASAEDETVSIISAKSGSDGQSIVVNLGWGEQSGSDTEDANATEVSWSTREGAWKSTDQPDAFTMLDSVWDDGPMTATIDGTQHSYQHSLSVTISGLEQDERYYVSARRVRAVDGESTTFGPYCTKSVVTPTTSPSAVVLSCGTPFTVSGADIPFSWTFDGVAGQTGWALMLMSGSTQSGSDKIIMSGSGKSTSCYVGWERVKDMFANNALSVYARVTTGGGSAMSDPIRVELASYPTVSVASDMTLTVQPLSFAVESSNQNVDLAVVVTAKSVPGIGPDGGIVQVDGDTVWSDVLSPTWGPASDYSSDTDLVAAKAALDSAQSDYDDAMADYQAAYDAYTAAAKAYEDGLALIDSTKRAYDDACEELDNAQAALDAMDPSDEDYAEAQQRVSDAEGAKGDAEDAMDDAENAIDALEDAMGDAKDAVESISIATEADALDSATRAYEAALASYISTVSEDRPYACTIELPPSMEFLDGGTYDVQLCATDRKTGLASSVAKSEVTVNWARKAIVPPEWVTVESFTELDDVRTLGADVMLVPSSNMASSDVYDVYRTTDDDMQLIADGVPTECTVRDVHAPFGDAYLRYRVVCRTVDGSTAWRDYDYYLLGDGATASKLIRIDYGEGFVELDHNTGASDSYDKAFESIRHLDGSISGHWSKGVVRSSTLTAALIRWYEIDKAAAVRALARHVGPCFVRTSDGVAYAANVAVNSFATQYGTAKQSLSLSVTEVEDVDEFLGEVIVDD